MTKKLPQVELPVYEIKADLRQGDLEKFELELMGLPGRLVLPSASKYGAELKAAIGAGWIVSPVTSKRTVEENGTKRNEYLFDGVEIADMHPAVVWKIGKEVDELYTSVTTIDPN
jgi:hypothetical protein